jgi:acetyl-CoA carboxylase biotin carboxyl carrier protein
MSDQDQFAGSAQDQSQVARVGAGERERGSDRSGGKHRGRRGKRGDSSQRSSASRSKDSSLNMDELREITELFNSNGLTEFEFENAEIRVRLSRNPAPSIVPTAFAHPAPPTSAGTSTPAHKDVSAAIAAATAATAAEATRAEEPSEELYMILSPIVGTFYRASSPTTEPFVRAGSTVEPDTTVCIIEAMKLMNEIQAETSGTVEKIYVENGQPVEYGQPLFGIKR